MPDITISLTAPQAVRLQSAFQKRFPEATVDLTFVTNVLKRHLRDIVLYEETTAAARAAQDAYNADPFEP